MKKDETCFLCEQKANHKREMKKLEKFTLDLCDANNHLVDVINDMREDMNNIKDQLTILNCHRGSN